MHRHGMHDEGQAQRVKETACQSYPAKTGLKADTYLLNLVHVEVIWKKSEVMKSNMYE